MSQHILVSWWLWFFFSLYFWIKQTILHVEIFRPTGLFKNYTISKYWLPITKETFAFYKNVNSGSALLSPHPAPPSPPDPSYQDEVLPLDSTSKVLGMAATPGVPVQKEGTTRPAPPQWKTKELEWRGWGHLHPGPWWRWWWGRCPSSPSADFVDQHPNE